MLLEDRDFDGAADCFREVARLQPNNTWPHTKLGLALAGKGDWDGAIANYDRALRVDARYSSAHRHKGDALVGKGQPAAVLAAYATAVELDPNDPGPTTPWPGCLRPGRTGFGTESEPLPTPPERAP